MVVLLVSLARRAYHFQQLASSSTPFHECRTYYLKSGATKPTEGEKDYYPTLIDEEACNSDGSKLRPTRLEKLGRVDLS
ncbi:hypothetical protein AB4622_26455 [Vibrio splendidus]|uniref:hypothetical protein n=1 Tax=Vibrio splendidus TaxID=29497 RepID=UPI002736951D|nr:hypothetical protein [Vibrio splendidus]MDP2592966.1 hypothetical protein [Vibrio splendidus]